METPEAQKPKRRQNRPALKYAEVERALRASAGIRSVAAEKLRVAGSTITRFIQRHPKLAAVEAEIVASIVDLAEGKLIEAIGKGEMTAIRYYLENKGQVNGFGKPRKLELTGAEGGPVRTAPEHDFSKLSIEEKRDLEALMVKAQPASGRP
jgi:hypothetical protein